LTGYTRQSKHYCAYKEAKYKKNKGTKMKNNTNIENTYNQLNDDALQILERIKNQLRQNKKSFESNPTNWGYIGSLTDTNKTLLNALFQAGGLTKEEIEKYKL
jgi:hypothetical protein